MRKLFSVLLLLLTCHQALPVGAHRGDTVLISDHFPINYKLPQAKLYQHHYLMQLIDLNGDTTKLNYNPSEGLQLNSPVNAIYLLIGDSSGISDTIQYTVYVSDSTNNGQNRIPIRGGKYKKFMSGINVAWKDFANDLNEFTVQDEQYFKEVLDSVKSNGGNSIRWWLHTNGSKSPVVNEQGFVESIEFESIQAIKHVLDLAYDRGIVVSLCLWSFDMLQNQNQDQLAMKKLLTDTTNVRSYIDHALIPILDQIGNHPAIMCWEIFNEAEGMTTQFGWTPEKVHMKDIQRFVNLTAGAIHRKLPYAQVSTGAWNMRVNSDINQFTNYYANDTLIALGNDPLGYLDFYQVHFYGNHFDNETSPFHKPASFWELDKPIVIGETWADTICCKTDPDISITEAYERAINYGYAGLMTWSWTDISDLTPTYKGLSRAHELIPDDITIPTDTVIDRVPKLILPVKGFRALLNSTNEVIWTDLQNHFEDEGSLSYAVVGNSNGGVVTPRIEGSHLIYAFDASNQGYSYVTCLAEDINGWYEQAEALVMVGGEAGNENNLAFFKPIAASSTAPRQSALFINDGSDDTFWESQYGLSDTILIDLQEPTDFNFVSIKFGNLNARALDLSISSDGLSWEQISVQSSPQRTVAVAFEEMKNARYQRIIMTNSNLDSHFKVMEVTVEKLLNNQSPELIATIPDVLYAVSQVRTLNNYILFDDIFSDPEHTAFLAITVFNSNRELLDVIEKPNGITLFFQPDQIGKATVTITATDPFGASVSTSFEVEVFDDLLPVNLSHERLTIKSNPTTNGLVGIESVISIEELKVYDSFGREVMTVKLKESAYELNLNAYQNGIYFLKVRLVNGERSTYKIIKN